MYLPGLTITGACAALDTVPYEASEVGALAIETKGIEGLGLYLSGIQQVDSIQPQNSAAANLISLVERSVSDETEVRAQESGDSGAAQHESQKPTDDTLLFYVDEDILCSLVAQPELLF